MSYDRRSRPIVGMLSLLLLLLLLSTLACTLPTNLFATPTSPPPPTPYVPPSSPEPTESEPAEPEPTPAPVPDVSYEGISFSFDDAIATSVAAETVPVQEDEYDVPWLPIPEHVEFTFMGYALPDTFHDPRIYVYPADEFAATNEAAEPIIADLRNFLDERPSTAPNGIPFLPLFNAGQMFQAHIDYVDFQNGTGVRFVTQYSQAAIPINNQELFYTFQGLTADGSYYVAAVLPVSNPILPADGTDIPGDDPMAFSENFESYLGEITAQLEAQGVHTFTPDLTLLDGMFQSLRVE